MRNVACIAHKRATPTCRDGCHHVRRNPILAHVYSAPIAGCGFDCACVVLQRTIRVSDITWLLTCGLFPGIEPSIVGPDADTISCRPIGNGCDVWRFDTVGNALLAKRAMERGDTTASTLLRHTQHQYRISRNRCMYIRPPTRPLARHNCRRHIWCITLCCWVSSKQHDYPTQARAIVAQQRCAHTPACMCYIAVHISIANTQPTPRRHHHTRRHLLR